MHLIISRTENNVLQEVLVILNSWVANSWIDPVDESIKISANHKLRNLYHLIIIHSWSSTNFQQPLSIVIERQWVPLVITLGGYSRRTQWSSSLDFNYYLYYSYSGCTTASLWSHVPLEPSIVTWSSRTFYGHVIFQNLLWSCDLVIWPSLACPCAIYILTPLYALRFWTKYSNAWEIFFCLGLS